MRGVKGTLKGRAGQGRTSQWRLSTTVIRGTPGVGSVLSMSLHSTKGKGER